MFSLFLALVWALLCCIMEAWSGVLVSLAVPLPSLLWQRWQRRRSVIFYQDHLADRTWFSTKIVSSAGTGMPWQVFPGASLLAPRTCGG